MTDAATTALCASVDPAALYRHLEEFARRTKVAGSRGERESFAYLRSCLDAYGYATRLLEHDAYISVPGMAMLTAGQERPDCITHSFSQPSPPGGLSGTLVHAGAGTEADFAAADVRGRVVLLDGIASPAASLRASRAGAIGQVHVSPHRPLHEMCVSPVWGSPTAPRLDALPRTVVVSIRREAGDRLKARLATGERIDVTIHAEVDTGWRRTPLLEADLPPGAADADDAFVMFSGHHDTWHYGVMDNGGANATMLEVARLLRTRQSALRRGLRLLFWSGHSQGRYSGSAWYADTHWDELARRCVAHVNIDSVGAVGNTVRSDAPTAAELHAVAAEAVRVHTGQELAGHRLGRAGDQSFWGIGVPSMFMMMSEQPLGAENPMASVIGEGRGRSSAGFGWWWHTPEDLIDKMDPAIHLVDTRIYLHGTWRLLTDPVLPLDHRRQLAGLRAELDGLASAEDVAIAPLLARLATLEKRVAAALATTPVAALNRALVQLSRALVPIDYADGDRFDHSPALPQAPWPVLDPVRVLAAAAPGSDAAKFAAVAARRALNRVGHALDLALAAFDELDLGRT